KSQVVHANLSAKHKHTTDSYSSQSKTINTSTTNSYYAAYIEIWRRKVELIGNLHYPKQALNQNIFGDLVLQVTVKFDGTVQKIHMIRSSGYQILDQAAINIVKLAAPFPPFPDKISQEVDMLNITRTWQFFKEN
ncbi:energy transducer TonB, partial [Achromatium sp. WMS1]